MKKALLVIVILIVGTAGFLAYDWYAKTTLLEDDQRVTLYSWTDENGARHFTNAQPPDGARNVEEHKGFAYTDRPLVLKLKDKAIDGYKRVGDKLFKKKKKKKKEI
jgi:heme-degrading monooxygenase HmoA